MDIRGAYRPYAAKPRALSVPSAPTSSDQITATGPGAGLTRLLNQLTAQLTTKDLIELNRGVEQGGQPQTVAADWLRTHDFTA